MESKKCQIVLVGHLPEKLILSIDKETFNKIITTSKNLYQNYDIILENKLNSLIKELYQIDDREYSYILDDLKREQ